MSIVSAYISEWRCFVETFLWHNGGKQGSRSKTINKYFNHGTPYYIKQE